MHNIVICSIASLFFNCVDGMPMGPKSNSKTHWSKKFNFISADKEIQDIVDQGVKDLAIDRPVVAFKQQMAISDEAIGTGVELMYHAPTNSDVYVISYSPWKGSPETIQNKRPFLFNHDLAGTTSSCEDSYVRRDKPHSGAQKFGIYHELAHIKNGDCDDDSYQKARLRGNLGRMKLVSIVGAAVCLLFAWRSNSTPKTKCMVAAGIGFLAHALRSNIYYHRFLANCRNQEFMADELACRALLHKNDPKPIVHWILDWSFERDYRGWEGKTDNPAENIGSTHPTHFERIQLFVDALKYSGIVWTRQLYDEIQKELDEDEHKAEKLVYLNQLHHMLLAGQNKNPIPLAWQKAKYKKFLQRDVLDGYLRGSVYEQVVQWKK